MKFELGKVVMTRSIADIYKNDKQFTDGINLAMGKYVQCDWGITCEEDSATNDEAVKNGDDRILAVYPTCKGNIWIITEWDRSVTTILFPSEY